MMTINGFILHPRYFTVKTLIRDLTLRGVVTTTKLECYKMYKLFDALGVRPINPNLDAPMWWVVNESDDLVGVAASTPLPVRYTPREYSDVVIGQNPIAAMADWIKVQWEIIKYT